tara:strand:+ start:38 stop:160 length:123 start_codon:yes stop_codon:yes gene_type:complete
MEKEIIKLIDKVESDTVASYTYEEVLEMLYDLIHNAEINY